MNSGYKLLMLSGDSSIASGMDGAFYQMLGRFSAYWERIDILTPAAKNASERTIHGNVFVHPAPNHRLLQPFFIKRRGEELLKQYQHDLLVTHDFGFFYNGIGAAWLLQGKTIPLVSEIHHIEGYPIATNWRERLWREAASLYLPFIAKRGAYFRVVNEDVAKQLETFGIHREKIRLLYSLYLDLERYQPQALAKQYDVLFVGRLASNKGILLLLDAIAQVRQTHPSITLAIRGEGGLEAAIRERIAQEGMEQNILFLPRVANSSAMPALYSSAKMLVCASTVEGNPRVTIEAMACGTPVISTRVGIMPSVIRSGDNGFLVDWKADEIAQAIRRLLDNEAEYRRIAEASRAAVQEFEADKTIRAYAEGYQKIVFSHQSSVIS
jgi:glycosyltransferase involved in cell wall biosynthesis